jgi:mannitol/fructose-specific phosphotransferase system IIA component (Ntr-type)
MPAFNKTGESDENSTRHEDNSEIVLEPETMIPHSWMEEVKYRGGSLNGKLQNRYTRTFECTAGS